MIPRIGAEAGLRAEAFAEGFADCLAGCFEKWNFPHQSNAMDKLTFQTTLKDKWVYEEQVGAGF
ncbi:hypothetical protein HMPREF3120_00460 [Corynebacterium sp. HMSC11D10]|nr:hypothetical protein HMPREF3120_00460 [Corynebacterium sp. HMSC11D10]